MGQDDLWRSISEEWRSISEDSPPPSPPSPAPSTLPKPRSHARQTLDADVLSLRERRRRLYGVLGGMAGLVLALPVLYFVRSKPPPPPPSVEPPKAAAAAKPRKPPPKTFADKMKELADREKANPREYVALYKAWGDLRRDAPAEVLETVREEMERLQAAATKEFRVAYHPIHEQVRELLGAHKPREAQKLLKEWAFPSRLDVTGDHLADLKKTLAEVADLVAFEDVRSKLFEAYRAGDFAADAGAALAPWSSSAAVQVRVEAENAVAELQLIRALGLFRQKLGNRRAAALARVEEARRQIAADAAAEKETVAGWEKRLQASTRKAPIPIQQLGVKDMDEQLRVAKFNGRTAAFASERMELSLTLDELPMDVYTRLILEAPDPAKASELLEAGKMAVRRNALGPAKTLFDRAVKVDRGVTDLVPDLSRIAGGVGTLRGKGVVQGDTLSIDYDFKTGEQSRDFRTSPGGKISEVAAGLALEGERLFYGLPGDLRFSGRIRISADTASASASAGYIVGVASEVAPGEPDLFVVLLQPDRLFRVIRLHRKGGQDVLGEGAAAGRGGLIEVAIDAGRAEFRLGGVTAWTGSLPDFATLQPVVGGYGFQEGAARVSYKSVRFEGRASPEWVRRLQSERLTVIEAELSKDLGTTRQEREGEDKTRSFGDGLASALPIEAELADLLPAKVSRAYAAGRAALQQLEKAKSEQAIARLSAQVRQCLEDAIREAPWFRLTYYYRAEWRYQEGDEAGAMRDLAEAAANEEAFVEARTARADLLLKEGEYAEAEREIDASLALVPDLARARLTKALLKYYAGRGPEAIAELELARRLEPGDLSLRRAAKRLRNVIAGPRWSGTVAIETPHYLVRAEAPRIAKKGSKEDADKAVRDRARKYADHLTAARVYFEQFATGPQKRAKKPLVFICDTPESYYAYADFTAEDRLEHTAGVFLGQYQQLLFYRDESEEETLQTMTHEAFHEYLHAIVPAVPIWMDEGMGEYVSGIKVEDARVVSDGGLLKGRLRPLQLALESGWEGFPFDFVFWEPKELFYQLVPELQYAQAWSMVHFFVHGQNGKYRPLLDRYIKVLIETRSAAEARAVFQGANLAAMQREWLSYVKALK